MNKKRALSILMAAAMAAGTLVTSVPVYADDVEEITWMFWDDLEATEDLISKGYKEVIDRFNEEYDGKYHVTPITTNLEEYDGKLNALIAAGQTPDVYICNPGPNMDVYVNAGAAADLTDILENQEADWYASFTDGIFERMTYDGKIMAVPTNFAAACVYYNTEMFADAGVEVYTTFVMISGDTIGNVTFQNVSYPVAPSIFATSYNAPGTDCSAAIKIMICTPDACTMSKIRPTAAVI